MKATIYITLKNGVLDPQGKAINNSLGHLGFEMVSKVRQGKFIELDLDYDDKVQAEKDIEAMCKKLLANTVIENYRFSDIWVTYKSYIDSFGFNCHFELLL